MFCQVTTKSTHTFLPLGALLACLVLHSLCSRCFTLSQIREHSYVTPQKKLDTKKKSLDFWCKIQLFTSWWTDSQRRRNRVSIRMLLVTFLCYLLKQFQKCTVSYYSFSKSHDGATRYISYHEPLHLKMTLICLVLTIFSSLLLLF